MCVDAISTSDSGWGGAVPSPEGSWGCPDTNGGSAKGCKGEVLAEIRHAYISDKASMTFLGLLRFWWQAHHQLASQLCISAMAAASLWARSVLDSPFTASMRSSIWVAATSLMGWYSPGRKVLGCRFQMFPVMVPQDGGQVRVGHIPVSAGERPDPLASPAPPSAGQGYGDPGGAHLVVVQVDGVGFLGLFPTHDLCSWSSWVKVTVS